MSDIATEHHRLPIVADKTDTLFLNEHFGPTIQRH